MAQTIIYKSEAEWLADNPLYRYRYEQGQNLPAPVNSEDQERPAIPQDEIAEAIGVTGMSISAWENDKYMPKYEKILALAALMRNISADDLYKNWLAWRQNRPAATPQETA